MSADVRIERSWLVEEPVREHAHPIGDFVIMCVFSVAGLMLTALGVLLISSEKLAQILAVAG